MATRSIGRVVKLDKDAMKVIESIRHAQRRQATSPNGPARFATKRRRNPEA